MSNLDAASTPSKKETAKKREVTPPAPKEAFALQNSPSITTLQQAVADPRTVRPAEILALQRRYGNQAVQRLLANRTLQAKLTVGAAHDTYEQEADRVAAQVMAVPASTPAVQRHEGEEIQAKPLAASITPLIRRTTAPEDEDLQAQFVQRAPEEEDLQAKHIQRETAPEEELQAKAVVQRSGDGFAAGADFETQLSTARGGGTPLPGATREFMEQRMGADFSGVKVHTDAQSDQLNRAIQAKAFTTGQDVFFRAGAYQPGSAGGQELIAHELTHVVQQNGGAVQREQIQAKFLLDFDNKVPPAAQTRTTLGEGYARTIDRFIWNEPVVGNPLQKLETFWEKLGDAGESAGETRTLQAQVTRQRTTVLALSDKLPKIGLATAKQEWATVDDSLEKAYMSSVLRDKIKGQKQAEYTIEKNADAVLDRVDWTPRGAYGGRGSHIPQCQQHYDVDGKPRNRGAKRIYVKGVSLIGGGRGCVIWYSPNHGDTGGKVYLLKGTDRGVNGMTHVSPWDTRVENPKDAI